MAPASKQSSKPVFKTSTPYTETKWPEISFEHQQVILELLCNLLTPIGDHRRKHIQPSKGRKRKRFSPPKTDVPDSFLPPPSPPPAPEIGSHILVGLNVVTRHLEALAARDIPSTQTSGDASLSLDQTPKGHLAPLSILVLTHPKPSLSPAHAHLPTLVHLVGLSKNSLPTILVALPTSADGRLASALHIPRVGAIAVKAGAPGAKFLEDYVREHVGVTECRWMDEAASGEWMGLHAKLGNQ